MAGKKRKVLDQLKRARLLEIADGEQIDLPERRALKPIREALARSRRLELEALLSYLSLPELRGTCQALGLEQGGRSRADLRDRIIRASGTARACSVPQGAVQGARDITPAAEAEGTRSVPPQGGRARGRAVAKLTLKQLERHLLGAADILRGKMDASEFKEYIFGMLFLKRCSDEFTVRREQVVAQQRAKGRSQAEAEKRAESASYYTDTFFVPEKARWDWLHNELHNNVGDGLNKALAAMEEGNAGLEGVLHHIDFTRTVGKSKLPDKKLRELIKHFNAHRLCNEDFEFPDLLGAAYEYLIGDFADSAGKKGGEFYTPRPVVRMMVRLAQPTEGMRIYDPCSGSGGMLIYSAEHIREHGGNPRNVELYGQEDNGGVWSISKMNMILHGISDAHLENGDTLGNPLHRAGGELMRFDRVITNPPFSQNYSAEDIPYPERFAYGMCPEKGKKADLMFVQHMLAVLRQGGMVCTVMPHGVLFRGGAEKEIRQGFIEQDDLLEAVIGLGSNLFYGTGIPACVLVLRAKGSKPPGREGKVLFINADAEYRAGRAQNYLDPEHVEKIVSAYERFTDIPGFARVVSHAELAANGFNLNIRRYADNAPPPEPHDVRAHLQGGVPRAEVEAQAALFSAHGFEPRHLLVERNGRYFDFAPDLPDRSEIKPRVEGDPGIAAREKAITDAFDAWWSEHEPRVADLARANDLMAVRAELLASFEQALVPVGLLDRFQVVGAVASWWGEVQYDLKTLMAHGFEGVVEGWVTTATALLEDEKAKVDPFSLRGVRELLPDYEEKLAEATARVAEQESAKEEFERGDEDEGEAEEEEGEPTNRAKELKDQIKTIKAGLDPKLKRIRYLLRGPTVKDKGSIAALERDGKPVDHLKAEIARLEAETAQVQARLEAREAELAPYNDILKALREAKTALKTLQADIAGQLLAAQARVTANPDETRQLVLALLRSDLEGQLQLKVTAQRLRILAVVQGWWDKYQVTLREIEGERDAVKGRLDGFLQELGYAV